MELWCIEVWVKHAKSLSKKAVEPEVSSLLSAALENHVA
jgi:hypothetical protein